VKIDVIFDTICPWCYIGKRRFERALALRPNANVDIRWRPFLLNPDMPPDGIDRRLYLESKFGSQHRVQRVFAAVTAAGQAEGIEFRFDRIRRTPSTIHSHRLIRLAALLGRQMETVEGLYRAYFVEGRDIGDIATLVGIGAEAGLPEAETLSYLDSDADVAAIRNDHARAHRLGVNGVPCFVFDEDYAVAGAQETDILVRMIDLAHETAAEPVLSGV
jgi:predicted DsbA family dithiol-disulfide isomerase